jgi:O-antigen/teichoic acid export membrane protein
MTIAQSLLRNTLARTATEIINRLGAAMFWVFVARALGVSVLGVLAFGLSLFSFFHTASTLGLGAVVIRDVARDRTKAGLYFGQTLIAGVVLSLIAAALMSGLGLLLTDAVDGKIVTLILAATLIPGSLFYWSKSLLSALEQMPYIALARLGENFFKVAVGIIVLVWNGDVLTMAAVIFFSKVVSAVLAFVFARSFVKPVWRLDKSLLRYFMRMTPAFSTTAITNSLFWAAPVVILSTFAGTYQAGLFGAAYKLVDVAISCALAYGQAMFPVVSRTLSQKRDTVVSLLSGSIKYSVMLTLAIAVGMTLLAPQLLLLVYGDAGLAATPVLRALVWMIVPFSMVPVLAFSLVSHSWQKLDVLANAAAALTVIALGLLLTPLHGALGAALSVLAGTILFWLIEWTGVQAKICPLPLWPHLWKPALAALCMASVLVLLQHLNLFYNITLAGVTYLLSLILSKALSKNELLMIKQMKSA